MGIASKIMSAIIKSVVNSKLGDGLGMELTGISIDECSDKWLGKMYDFIYEKKNGIENIFSKEKMESMKVDKEKIDFVVMEIKWLLSKIEITEELFEKCRHSHESLSSFLWEEYCKRRDVIENEGEIRTVLHAVAGRLIALERESGDFEKRLLEDIASSVNDIDKELRKISDYMKENFDKLDDGMQAILLILEQIRDMSVKTRNYNVITSGSDIAPSNHFVGRKKEIELLLSKIGQYDRVLLNGMGGMGKTTILKKVYHQLLEENRGNEKIQLGYFNYKLSIAETIYCALKFEKTGDRMTDVNRAKVALEEYSDCKKTYIFIDNVPAGSDEELNYLDSISGTVVISSRQTEYEKYETVPVGRLGLEECIEIFNNEYKENKGSSDDPNLKYIIDNLIGGHTLTIKLLANIAKRKEWTLEELKNRLVAVGFKINFTKSGRKTNILTEYKKLYSLSELNEDEKNILESFSLLREAELDRQKCERYLGRDVNDFDMEHLFGLYGKGWLEKEHTKYRIHPVFAEFIAEVGEIDRFQHINLFQFVEALAENINDLEMQKKQDDLAEIISFAKYAPLTKEKCEMEKLLLNIAKIAYFYTEYDNAVFILKRIDTDNKENYIFAQLLLSEIYLDKNEFEQVKKHLNHVSAVLETYKNDLLIVDYKINYALYLEKSSKNDADRRKAIDELLNVEKLAMDDERKSRLYNCLGGFYTNLEKNSENLSVALNYHKRAQTIREKYAEDEVLDLARTYNNIANVYYYTYKIKQEKLPDDSDLLSAKKFYEQSFGLRKKVYNKEHPDIARIYANLGNVYFEQNDYENALQLMKDGLKIRLETIGKTTREVAITKSNIMGVYVKLKDKEHALQYGEESECIYEVLYGKESEAYIQLKTQHDSLMKNI